MTQKTTDPVAALQACRASLEKIAEINSLIEAASYADWRRKVKIMAVNTLNATSKATGLNFHFSQSAPVSAPERNAELEKRTAELLLALQLAYQYAKREIENCKTSPSSSGWMVDETRQDEEKILAALNRPTAANAAALPVGEVFSEHVGCGIRVGSVKWHQAAPPDGTQIYANTATATAAPAQKPYAYEYGKSNGDGTYSVVIERGDLVQVGEKTYEYGPPKRAHKDWPVKPLYDTPTAVSAGDQEPAGWHAGVHDDLTLEEATDAFRHGWVRVRGRTERQLLAQIIELLANSPTAKGVGEVCQQELRDAGKPSMRTCKICGLGPCTRSTKGADEVSDGFCETCQHSGEVGSKPCPDCLARWNSRSAKGAGGQND